MKIRKLKLTCSQKYVEADYIGQTVDVSSSSRSRGSEMMEATAGGRSPESTLLDLDPTNLYQIPQEYDHRHPKSRWTAGQERDCGTNALAGASAEL